MPRHGRRQAWRFAIGLLVVICTGVLLLSVRGASSNEKGAHFEHAYSPEYVGTVWFTLSSDSTKPRQVVVRWGRLRRSFEHRSATPVIYTVEKGVGKERSDPLLVDVQPAADVTFNFGKAPEGSVDLSAQPWEALPYSSGVAAPRPANADSATATAAVDESVSYGGVDPAGIGVRAAPKLDAGRLTAVKHGEVYTAVCWARGQEITNSNLSDPADDAAAYTSDIWWKIDSPVGPGFIADAWFARRGLTDRLNLRECDDQP